MKRRRAGSRETAGEVGESTREPISEQAINQLKQEMSLVFREGGYIQLLNEEKFTLRIVKWALRHPNSELGNKLMDLIRSHDQITSADSRSRVRTALAFSFASHYLTKVANDAGRPSSAFAETSTSDKFLFFAQKAIKEVEQESKKKVESRLFIGPSISGSKDPSIEAGHVRSNQTWTGEKATRSIIEQTLSVADLQSTNQAQWKEVKSLPHSRTFLKLSSLQLSYAGKSLQSMERILYTEAEKNLSATKITTTDNTHYFQIDAHPFLDPMAKVIRQVQPFLSGTQFEEDNTAMKPDKKPDSQWQSKDLDWHLLHNNRASYHNVIHPAIARYTQSVIEHLVQQGKKEVTILDIAGGSGDLGERIIKDTREQFPELSIKYRLVDYSQDDVDMANERFSTLRSDHITASATCRDMLAYNFDAEQMKHDADIGLPQEGADIVINSGGLLNNSVIGDAETPVNFNRMYANSMSKGGFGIYSGLSSLLINSTDHLKNGMKIQKSL